MFCINGDSASSYTTTGYFSGYFLLGPTRDTGGPEFQKRTTYIGTTNRFWLGVHLIIRPFKYDEYRRKHRREKRYYWLGHHTDHSNYTVE